MLISEIGLNLFDWSDAPHLLTGASSHASQSLELDREALNIWVRLRAVMIGKLWDLPFGYHWAKQFHMGGLKDLLVLFD